jgi:hypothetical protein
MNEQNADLIIAALNQIAATLKHIQTEIHRVGSVVKQQ